MNYYFQIQMWNLRPMTLRLQLTAKHQQKLILPQFYVKPIVQMRENYCDLIRRRRLRLLTFPPMISWNCGLGVLNQPEINWKIVFKYFVKNKNDFVEMLPARHCILINFVKGPRFWKDITLLNVEISLPNGPLKK